ncbi:MAG: phosphoglucosamine mutase, partial [Negativicutes bacterium]|nr:phosphoglucosamine mutase [Negativicutes bacterium]
MARLFGTDGVRGVANRELSALLAYRLGRAVTFYFGRDRRRPQIIIGRDTRISGEMLEAALAAGVCSAGGDAVLLGVVPTPAVAFVTKQTAASAGAMISASHNPFPDNGIKFFAADGYKLADDIEDAIELIVAADEDNCPFPDGENIGRIVGRRELVEQYIDHICRTVAGDLGDWRILVDCANGSASTVAGEIWRRLGVKAEVINHRPDGLNINDRCGSTHLDGLIAAVRAGG